MTQKRSLNICIFADERSIHARRWVTGLRALGHEVSLITLRKDANFDIGGIDLGASTKLVYLTKIPTLRRLVRKLSPDIFHAHYASSYGYLASFLDHPRKIVSVWGDDIVEFPENHFIFRSMIKRSLEKAYHITATNQFLKDISMKFNCKLPTITIIPFGIDLESFPYANRPQSKTVRIGIAKGLRPKYGVDILIRAFAGILQVRPDVELHVAGRGSFEESYGSLLDKLNLRSKVKFLGLLPHERIPQFLSDIDIFAMPSISDGESFGVAALEASATGLPVVATKVGGVPEVVIDGETGILVERGNVEELAQAILRLIQQPELRIEMGQAGRRLVEHKYRWEDNLRAMIDLYYQLMP